MRAALVVDNLCRDIVRTVRTLRKHPAFALTAIVTLALGIGANTAIFTIVRTVLLRPLSYREPDRLVLITSAATPIRFAELQKSARSYTDVGDYLDTADDVALTGSFTPEVIKQARVSANFLSILGVQPLIGRSFTAEEDSRGVRRSPSSVAICGSGDSEVIRKLSVALSTSRASRTPLWASCPRISNFHSPMSTCGSPNRRKA